MSTETPSSPTRLSTSTKWVPLVGSWNIGDGVFQFVGFDDASWKVGIALSDLETTTGVFSASIVLDEVAEGCGRIVFGHDSADGTGYSAGIGGYGKSFTISRYSLNRGSRMVAGIGKKENLKLKQQYDLRVVVQGSNVKLSVDGVEVLNHNLPNPPEGDQIGLLGYGDGTVTFSNVNLEPSRPRAFVVMQFSEPYNSLWEEVIRPVADRVGFDAYRADNVFQPGIILQDIVRGINTSQAIIAEVTPRNPNVYYELGYAHAVGTPTVLLAEQPEGNGARLPFDISGFRCIFYEDAIRGKRKVEQELEKHLRNILSRSGNGVA